MKRITDYKYATVIEAARARIPEHLLEKLQYVDFFCGADPVFAGLHHIESTGSGYSYRTTWHANFPCHTNDKTYTIVMPQLYGPEYHYWHVGAVIHELAHCLDWMDGWKYEATAITWHAETERCEAFAEAFAFWLCPQGGRPEDKGAWEKLVKDEKTVRLLRELTDGL